MEKFWEEEWGAGWGEALPVAPSGTGAGPLALQRLDLLLPTDPRLGVVTFEACRSYLGAMMELTARHGQPLSLLCITADPGAVLNFLGVEGADLIGRAIARYLRQETRLHDVIGLSNEIGGSGIPVYLVICPLMTEEQAARLAERVRVEMTAHATQPTQPWLTLSVGVVGMSLDVSDPDGLIARAVSTLKRAQRAGGNCTWRHTGTLRQLMENDSPGDAGETLG